MVFSIAACRETAFSIAKGLHYGQNYPWETQAVCGGGGGEYEVSKICQHEVANHSRHLDNKQIFKGGKARPF